MGINFTDILTTAPVIAATFNNPLDELDQAIGLNAYAKTAAPTVNDDSADGYTVGSRWIDTTNDRIYVAVDVTAGAAIWLELGAAHHIVNLPAMAFALASGTPAQGNLAARYGTWRLDDAAIEIIGTSFPYQGWKSGSSIYVEVLWAMESATSGNAVMAVRCLAIGEGEDAGATAGEAGFGTQTVAVPGTAKFMKKVSGSLPMNYAPGDLIRISFERQGSHASDTATGDLHFLGMTMRFL